VVDVEQRALRPLEQDALPGLERGVDERGGLGDQRAEPLGERRELVEDAAGVGDLAA
jgi:hypothetical protein